MKYYMVTFDRENGKSYKKFHNDFTSHHMMSTWFHYIKSSYIIGSNSTANDISDHFTKCAKENNLPATHLVVEVNLRNRQGMLVEDAWSWCQKNS